MPSVRLDKLRKRFGDALAVNDISVEFRDGEMTSVLGPSGCGKTTTLNLIAGFLDPDNGTIHFGDRLIADSARGVNVPPNKRNLGMVFQSYALWPHLSVADNVAYGLKMRQVARAQRDVSVKRALKRVRLEPFIDRFPHELSGGQQQRVALARAIAYSPQILLFDEPLSNLDAQLREEMRLELKDIHREIGITAIYVTHDQAEAMSLSDRIVVMGDGQVLQVGSPRDLYDKPGDVRVARFLGRTNLFDALIVEAGAPMAQVRIEGTERSLLCRAPPEARPNTRGTLSVRPEAVAVRTAGGAEPGLPGRVTSAIYLGNVSQIHVALDLGKSIEVQQVTRQTWNVGDAVSVAFDPDRCYFIAGARNARSVS
ncbi:MAG TPA: ABC transporter ATP-binding protein [Xanthobacteraceae bacterium]|jgi:iron(III) transport system ATP-binding protein